MEPGSGRFLGMDPWRGFAPEPPSLHRYLYAAADPVSRIDPTGRFSGVQLGVAITIATIAAIALAPLAVMGMFPFAGTSASGPTRDEKTGSDSLTLYHGTSSNRAARIVGSEYYAAEGFRPGRDYHLAEDFVTAELFALMRYEDDQPKDKQPRSFTVITFTMPFNLGWRLGLLRRGPIGFFDGSSNAAPSGSTGFQRVLREDKVPAFNFHLIARTILAIRIKVQ